MSVAQLKARRKTKKNSFNQYVKRRDKTKDIISKIDNKLDDDINSVNNQIEKCISELEQGLKGASSISRVCRDLESLKEPGTYTDSKLTSCKSYLRSEVTRCQGRINTLDTEIRTLERQIREEGGTIYWWE